MKVRLSLGFLLLTILFPLFANDADQLEIIEVTAQKKIESIQTVPIAITALSSSDIETNHVVNAQDISSLVPNLNSNRSISGIQNYFIRGIGLDDFNLSSVASVGLYVDDVAVQNPMLAAFTLFDIDRVEVLKGPQNTLYGKNTTAGAIKFVTTPADYIAEYNGYIKVSVGSDNRQYLDGASSFLLTEDTALRVAGFRHTADGDIRSKLPNNQSDYGNTDRLGFRVKLQHIVTDQLELKVALHGGTQRQITPVKALLIGTEQQPQIDIGKSDLAENASEIINPRDNIDAIGGFLKLVYTQDDLELSSISSFEHAKSQRMDDWGSQDLASNIFQILTYNSTDTQSYTQELQLLNTTPLHSWLVGLAIHHDTGALAQAAYIDPGSRGRPDDSVVDAGGGALFDRASKIDLNTTTYSAYGHVNHPFSDKLNLTIGYRFTSQHYAPEIHSLGMMMDDPSAPFPLGTFGWYSLGNPGFDIYQDYVGFDQLAHFEKANGGTAASAIVDQRFNEWGGKVALDYQVDKSTLLYTSVSRGFKMGTVNSNPTTIAFHSLMQNTVKPETMYTYEAGWKTQLLDNTLRVNGAIFANIWQDYQFYLVHNPGSPDQLFASLVNLPEAQSNGAEIEVNWRLSPLLDTKIAIGYLSSEVTDGRLDVSGVIDEQQEAFQSLVTNGNALTNAPDWTINGSVTKIIELSQSDLILHAQINYTSDYIHILAGNNSDVWQTNFSEKATTVINANINYVFGKQKQFQIGLWANNITDQRYCDERASIPGTPTELVRLCSQNQPRTLGATFRYLYD